MEYTQYLELWSEQLVDEDYDDDDIEQRVLDFLNAEDTFRDFGEGLTELISEYIPRGSNLSAKEFLKSEAEKQGISFNRNTLSNWFDGTRPKKSEQSREHMYQISFALCMDIEDTKKLFKKVYFDRPFNLRSIKEFVYYYSINQGYGYQQAQNLLREIPEMATEDDLGTIQTMMIQQNLDTIQQDSELLQYISSHIHNFHMSNRKAKEILEKLVEQIRVSEEEKELYLSNKLFKRGENRGYLIREIARLEDVSEIIRRKNLTSIETMLDYITFGIVRGKSTKSGQSIFKGTRIPQEIASCFPKKQTFSKTEPTFEELRKMIILLFSYKYWYEQQWEGSGTEFEDYWENLNILLYDCGLQDLYYGNPFDWLFLYCARTDEPLSIFREIINECVNSSENDE